MGTLWPPCALYPVPSGLSVTCDHHAHRPWAPCDQYVAGVSTSSDCNLYDCFFDLSSDDGSPHNELVWLMDCEGTNGTERPRTYNASRAFREQIGKLADRALSPSPSLTLALSPSLSLSLSLSPTHTLSPSLTPHPSP